MGTKSVSRPIWPDEDVAAIGSAHGWMDIAIRGLAPTALNHVLALRKPWEDASFAFGVAVEEAAYSRRQARSVPSKRKTLQALAHRIKKLAMTELKAAAVARAQGA